MPVRQAETSEDAILAGRPIKLFNRGDIKRDFTYVDDVATAVVKLVDVVPQGNPAWSGDDPDPSTSYAPWRVYNIGNHTPVELMEVVGLLEQALGKPALEASLNTLGSATMSGRVLQSREQRDVQARRDLDHKAAVIDHRLAALRRDFLEETLLQIDDEQYRIGGIDNSSERRTTFLTIEPIAFKAAGVDIGICTAAKIQPRVALRTLRNIARRGVAR